MSGLSSVIGVDEAAKPRPDNFFPISQNLFLFFIYFDPNLKEKKKKKPLMCRERGSTLIGRAA
jgi:hypothetical protein